MKKAVIIIIMAGVALSLFPQAETRNQASAFHHPLSRVEENNTTLKALRETVEAEKLENKTGIYLSGPEAGFNYLWGSPSPIGNRTDFSLSQTFDIPTLTGMKSRVAKGQNELLEWQYRAARMEILLEAKLCVIDLIHYNALKREMEWRLQHAETLAAAYNKRLKEGDANQLEYNRALLNLSLAQGELSRVEVERNALLSKLKSLNGGNEIALEEDHFPPAALPANFDDWYAGAEQKNPVLAYVRQEVELGKKQVSLNKAMNLPSFSAGYMSEKVVGERFQGITLGVSIPLWENKNRVKQAKAAVKAAESREADSKQRFYSELQTLYQRTLGLQSIADNYRNALSATNNLHLLQKALDAGGISVSEYITEAALYYDATDQALEAERDYQKAFAELSAVEL